ALHDVSKQLDESVSDVSRVASGIREALQLDWASGVLEESVESVRSVGFELREELARLSAFRRALADGYPAVARAVEHASVKAATRFAELTRAVEELGSVGVGAEETNGHDAPASLPSPDLEGETPPAQWS